MEANNMKALREFAEYLANYPTCEGCEGKKDSRFCESCPKGVALAPIAMQARIALAKPPRNCDKFRNADEALEALERHCNSSGNGCIRCPVAGSSTEEVECKIAWLLATATERKGETDGSN